MAEGNVPAPYACRRIDLKTINIKRIISLICILSIIFTSSSNVFAIEKGTNVQNANTLQALGLFKGTLNGFDLMKTSTRAEGAVMLVRLLGAENIAVTEANKNKHPFTDVPSWANPHVSYLYSRGLTNGIDTYTFGTDNLLTANQYTTMLLRALGYSDKDGDYKWDNSLDYAGSVNLLNQQDISSLKALKNKGLLRDWMVKMSYSGLFTNMKNTDKSLLINLIEQKAISEDKLRSARLIDFKLNEFLNNNGYKEEELRAVWITYLELLKVFEKNKTAGLFQEAIKDMYKEIKDIGLNTVIVQIKPFSDAVYPSNNYPWSYIITGKEGGNPGFDPLKIMIDEAHKQGIRFEAWINPFRVRTATSKVEISNDNIAKVWLNDKSNRVFQIPQGIFYNPASKDVRNLITKGVVEIINNYNVDGIHFDDYFYPSTDLNYDSLEYNQYKKEGGKLSQADWRRENINIFVKGIYSEIKTRKSQVQFGISPQGSFEANYNQQFIDVEKWVSSSNYIDYICPQIYFGYEHEKYPYMQMLEKWDNIIKNDNIRLYIGMAAYKVGREDIWAGKGKEEWINSNKILQKMILDARSKKHYGGFALFRYDNIVQTGSGAFVEQMKEEIEVLKTMLFEK